MLSILLIGLAASGCDSSDAVERSYTMSIEREAANDFEASLITRAEAIYPSRDSVIAVARDSSQIPETEYWFYTGIGGGMRLPYAITGDAIEYYADLLDEFEAGGKADPFPVSASLRYQAEVSFHEAYFYRGEFWPYSLGPFENVYVVEMSLRWGESEGNGSFAGFIHERSVLFDEEGTLIGVFGDGPAVISVS